MSEQDLLDTPLNAPNAEQNLFEAIKPAEAPVIPDYFNQALDVSLGTVSPAQQILLDKQILVEDKRREKVNRHSKGVSLEEYMSTPMSAEEEAMFLTPTEGAVGFSTDQAQKMVGAGIRTMGDLFGSKSAEDWGQDIINQQDQDIKYGKYESEYKGSIRDTFNNEGFGASVGWIWEKMLENSVSSGTALVGAGAAALTAPFSATAATVMGAGVLGSSVLMGAGETALEMEDKGVDVNSATAAGVGVIIGLLDKFGAGKVIPKNLLMRMTGDQVVSQLVKKGKVGAAKAFAKELVKKGSAEVATEIGQESLIAGAAATAGAKYTTEEIVDRMIDTAFVSLGMTTAPAVAATTIQQGLKGTAAVVQKTAEVVQEAVSKAPSATVSEELKGNPVYKAVQFVNNADLTNLTSHEESTKVMGEIYEKIEEANEFIINNPDEVSDELKEQYSSLLHINEAVLNAYNKNAEQSANLEKLEIATTRQLIDIVQKNTDEDKKTKLKNNILFSFQTSEDISIEVAQEVKNSLDLNENERQMVDLYIERKSMQQVGQDVQSGKDGIFLGIQEHNRIVNSAIAAKDDKTATRQLTKFSEFINYSKMKVNAFNEVVSYNEQLSQGHKPQDPPGVTVLERSATGAIKEFAVDNPYGFGYDGNTRKSWKFSSRKGLKNLSKQISSEVALMDNYHQSLQLSYDNAFGSKPDITVAPLEESVNQPVQESVPAVPTEVDKEADRQAQEEFFNDVVPTEVQEPQQKQQVKEEKQEPVAEVEDGIDPYTSTVLGTPAKVTKVADSLLNMATKTLKAINPKGLIKEYGNFFGSWSKGKVTEEFTEAEFKTLADINEFNNQFLGALRNVLPHLTEELTQAQQTDKAIKENPLVMLMERISVDGKEIGQLPPEVTQAMVFGAIEWLGTQAGSTVYNDDRAVNSILGRDTSAKVVNAEARKIRSIGAHKGSVAQTIGMSIINQLGLKIEDTAHEHLREQLAVSIGMAALDTMFHMGLVTQSTHKMGDLIGKAAKKADAEVTFVRAATTKVDGRDVVNERIKDMSDNYSYKNNSKDGALSEVITKLSGEEREDKFPGSKPRHLGAKDTYLRSNIKLPKAMRKLLNYANKVQWSLRPEMVEVIKNSSREELMTMLGYVSDTDNIPMYRRESVLGKNNAIEKEVDNVIKFIEAFEASGDKYFHYSYNTANNGRHMIAETQFSYQASKLVRHLINPKDPNSSIDFTSTVDRSDPAMMHRFRMAIVQAMDLGDIDKQTPESIADLFDAKAGDRRINTFMKAARLSRDGKPFMQVLLSDGSIEKDNEFPAKIDAVVAMGAYLKASKNKEGTFQVTIPIELDAITSGVGIGEFNMGATDELSLRRLQAAGIFIEDNAYINYRANKGQDNYEMVADIWERELKTNEKMLLGLAGPLQTIIGEVKRSMAKDPVMLSNYQAQHASLRTELGNTAVEAFYEQLHSDDPIVSQGAIDAFNAIGDSGQVKTTGVDRITTVDKEFILSTAQENMLRNAVDTTYGAAMVKALDQSEGSFPGTAQQINKNLNLAFLVYQKRLEELEAKFRDNKGEISVKHRKMIMEHPDLVKLRPIMEVYNATQDTGLYMGKVSSERVYDEGSRLRSYYPKGTTINGSKVSVAYAQIQKDGAPGVSGMVRAIQHMDASIMLEVLGTGPIMSVYDGVYTSLDRMEEDGQKYNQAFLSIGKQHDIYAASQKLAEIAMDFVEDQSDVNSYEDFYNDNVFPSPDARVELNTIIDDAKSMGSRVTEWRDTLHNHLVHRVDHVGTPGTSVEGSLDQDTNLETALDSLFDKLVEEVAQSDQKADFSNFVAQESAEISGDNVEKVFDTLGHGSRQGNVQENSTHESHLRGVLTETIAPLMNKLGGVVLELQRTGNFNQGRMLIDSKQLQIILASEQAEHLSDSSEKTLYVHELIHAITFNALFDPANSAILNEITKLREKVRKHLEQKYNNEPWKIFLKRDQRTGDILYVVSEADEIKRAKALYAYVFSNKKKYGPKGGEMNAGLHEFMAYAMTDARLIAEMKNIAHKAPRTDKSVSVAQRIQDMFMNLMEWLTGKIDKTTDVTADKSIQQMIMNLQHTQQNKVGMLQKFTDKVNATNSAVHARYEKLVLTPLHKWSWANMNSKIPGVKQAAIALGAANPLVKESVIGKGENPFQEAIDKARRGMGITKRNLAMNIFKSITGPSSITDRVLESLLLRSRQMVDKMRDSVSSAARHALRGSFLTEMNNQEWIALTQGVLRTDLGSLWDVVTQENYREISKILTNKNGARNKKISDIQKQLAQYGGLGNYYINQSRSLGHFMARGHALVRDGKLNAAAISQAVGVVDSKRLPADIETVEGLIDQLATLYAIDNTTADSNRMTALIMEREFAASSRTKDKEINGFTALINMASEHKVNALSNNFQNNKLLMIKGHIKDVTDPNKSVQVAPVSEEHEMKKHGLKLIQILSIDPNDPDQTPVAMYAGKGADMQAFLKSALSTTGMHAKGTSIMQRNMKSGAVNNYKASRQQIDGIVKANRADIKRQMQSDNYTSKGSVLVPTINEKNQVVDYRYTMGHHTKQTFLDQDLRADVVLGAMEGNVTDKQNSEVINEQILDALKADKDANILRDKGDYVEISANSPNAEYRELYRLLPEHSRQYAKKLFGKDAVVIRTDHINLVFGQRALSISKIPFLNNMMVKTAEAIWKEIVALAKKNIVIKTGSVLYYNILSNTMFGILNGVNPTYMIKEQFRAARDIHQYQENTRKLGIMKNELAIHKRQGGALQTHTLTNEIATLEANLELSPVHTLVKEGLFQSIVEDLDATDDPYKFSSKMTRMVNDLVEGKDKATRTVGAVRTAHKYAYMTDDTSVFKVLMKATQYSDFVARQAVYKYKTEVEGMSKEETKSLILDMFVNYEVPDDRWVQYLNDTGILMFTKYPIRILRSIIHTFQGKPLNLLGMYAIENMLDVNISDPTDTTLGSQLAGPFRIFEEATTMSGYEMAAKVIR